MRPDALEILRWDLTFKDDITVLVPERLNWTGWDYLEQVEWEWEGLEKCDAIVFWIPRNLLTMPAFTTNVEFGSYVRSGRAWYGRPDDSPKNGYLDWLYTKTTGRTPFNNLKSLLSHINTVFGEYKS